MVVVWVVRITNTSDYAYHIEHIPGMMEWQTPKVDGCSPPYIVMPDFSSTDIQNFAIPHSGHIRIWCEADESCKVDVFVGARPGQFEGEDWLQFRTPNGAPVGLGLWRHVGQSQMFGGKHLDFQCNFTGALPAGVEKAVQFTPYSPNDPEDVLLNVYDLANQVSSFNGLFANNIYNLFGFFHTGLEVYGEEWSFYRTPGPECGICRSRRPKEHAVHVFRQSVNLGRTSRSKNGVRDVLLSTLKSQWAGDTYNLLERNCISFCSAFAKALGADDVPSWVSNLHESASSVASVFPWLKPMICGESDSEGLESSAEGAVDETKTEPEQPIKRRSRASTMDERIAAAVSASRVSRRVSDHPWRQASIDSYESLVFLDDVSDNEDATLPKKRATRVK